MSAPVSYQILQEVQERLQAINPAAGYNTAAGDRVYLGRKQVNPDQTDIGTVLTVYDSGIEAVEGTAHGYEPVQAEMTIQIDAHVRDVNDEGAELAHLLTQDVFNAMLDSTDQTLGGIALDIGFVSQEVTYPEPGGDTMIVTLVFTSMFEMPYGNM